ncbi:Uma2 family endonuclease [Actinoplanes sp. TRM 88003]|uniref:Uma2 family endonuclease n=1 Tax=Paractinoplanes aksuensis TaxID=2939490 RepID=A0ABT1DG94_9ACTN|nr:Uma2 family endonuclease [Actinoplanes aksuensis]MCO8269820.1 Uma2 family endonuclease [Actinoplanes aksuensis]
MTEGKLRQRGRHRDSVEPPDPGEPVYRLGRIAGEVVPSLTPTVPHQNIAHLLVRALRTSAHRAGLGAHGSVLVRLSAERLIVPDLAVARVDRLASCAEGADTVLVGEVTRPGSDSAATPSRIEHFAAAGIPWFLLAQPETPEHRAVSIRLFHLRDGRYLEHTAATPGQTLVTKDPFPFRIRTTDLVVF